ncbi:MAG TPA: hypothetical protein VFU14_13320 [Acidimicrobiales bacterium]|nr:hypothetical protein [Acidimicrobiales bacterium]
MAKRSRRRPRGGRVTPPRVWPEDEPGLPPLEGVVAALEGFTDVADRSPLGIEVQVSTFLGQLGAGQGAPEPGEPDHEELLNGIVELCLHHLDESPPRVVLDFLWVLDAFDPGWIAWPLHDRLAMAALPSRPAWAMDVGQAEVVRTVVAEHETGDGFDVAIVARHRSAPHDHVVAVYVDRLLGGLATDLLVHDDAEEYLRLSNEAEGMTVREIEPAVAAATIDEAIDATFAAGVPAAVADGFSPLWAVVEHYVAKLPGDGDPLPPLAAFTPEGCADVVDRFLGSIDGLAHRPDRAPLLEAVRFVADELGGDPLRWTAPVTQLILGAWLPLAELDDDVAQRFPKVLRAFVPWAHREHGWGDRYLAEPLEVIRAAEAGELPGPSAGGGTVEILEQAVAAGVDLDDEAALDAFLDRYLDEHD